MVDNGDRYQLSQPDSVIYVFSLYYPPLHQMSLDLSPHFTDPTTLICNHLFPLTWVSLSILPPAPPSPRSFSHYTNSFVPSSVLYYCRVLVIKLFSASAWNWDLRVPLLKRHFCYIPPSSRLHRIPCLWFLLPQRPSRHTSTSLHVSSLCLISSASCYSSPPPVTQQHDPSHAQPPP